MEKPRPSTVAWGILGAGVLVYDVLCPTGETLSEGVDRAMETKRGKVAAMAGIAVVAGHLANLIPEDYDPLHRATKLKMLGKENA